MVIRAGSCPQRRLSLESLSEEEANQPQAGKVEQGGRGRREELGLQ